MNAQATVNHSDVQQNSWFSQPQNQGLVYIAVIVVTAVFGLVIYQWLPQFNIDKPANMLSLNRLYLLLGLIIGGTVYGRYIQYLKTKPFILLIIFLFGLPLISYLNSTLIKIGFNFRWNQLSALFLWTPTFFFIVPAIKTAFKRVPFFPYLLFFCGLFLIYFFFFNAHAIVVHNTLTASGGYRTLDMDKAYNIFMVFFGLLSITYAVFSIKNRLQLFHKLNTILAWVVITTSVVVIMGYPFSFLTEVIEGFRRSGFIYSHPNQLGHNLGFMLIYLLGMKFYYVNNSAVSNKVLNIALGLGGLALLLTFSKTAIAATAMCLILLFLVYSALISFNKKALLDISMAASGMLLLLFLMQVFGIFDVFEILQSRINDSSSLLWRFRQWESLLHDFNRWTDVVFGHGLTASSAKIFQLKFSDSMNPTGDAVVVVGIHNGYLDTFYDFGLLGLVWVFGLIYSFFINIRLFVNEQITKDKKIVLLSANCMIIYALIGCFFDELLYSMLYPFLYFTTVIYLVFVDLDLLKNKPQPKLSPVSRLTDYTHELA